MQTSVGEGLGEEEDGVKEERTLTIASRGETDKTTVLFSQITVKIFLILTV